MSTEPLLRVSSERALRALFVNENVAGHATMHLGIRHAMRDHPEIDPTFLDVPRPGLLRRIVRLPVPGLARLDLDLQPLRSELAKSTWVRRQVRDRRERIEVLHVYTQNAALLIAEELRRHPSVLSTDGTGMLCASLLPYREPTRFTPTRARLGRLLERRAFDAATLVVAQSSWAAQSLRDDYGIDDDRLRVIPFGVVVPDAVATHASGDGTEGTRREITLPELTLPEITWVGGTMRRKGGSLLLQLYRDRLRDRCRLNLVTRERVPEEPGVRVFNDIHPNDGQLTALLARSAVLAFPSSMDTFGYVALEAMAVGVPVVGFALNALPELVDDGVTGLLTEPDGEALVAAMLRLIDDPALRVGMGHAARARVLERYDARVTTARLIEVLKEARSVHAG